MPPLWWRLQLQRTQAPGAQCSADFLCSGNFGHVIALPDLAGVDATLFVIVAVAKRDADTDTHNYRVTLYATRLAEAMKLETENIASLIVGAFLHDVWKIGIPEQILLKPGPLTVEEFEIMKTHVSLGSEIIQDSVWLKRARNVVLFHHEKFDGSGHPLGLGGNDIPLDARLFAVVDVFDALMSRRPYKEPLSFDEALKVLQDGAGKHFAPEVVSAFEPVAKALYGEIGLADKAYLKSTLKMTINKYF